MYENKLTEGDCKNVLIGYFGQNNVKVINYNIKPISEKVEGFAGDHFKVKITCEVDGEEKVENFFLKTKPSKTEVQKELIADLNIYVQEIFLYDFILREFKKYGFDTTFAPKCYYCIPDESIILEDITLNGFTLPPIFTFLDLEQCKCGLRSLALLHAGGYMYEEVKTKELGRKFRWDVEYSEHLARESFYDTTAKKTSMGVRWMANSKESFLGLIDQLPESEQYREDFKVRLRERKFGVPFLKNHNIRKTIGHGDLWTNNMMFKFENGVVKQCCLLDYQLMRYYYPAFDVYLFLYTNTPGEFRRKHMTELFEFYYTTLSDILHDHGYSIEDIHPKSDFEASKKIVQFEPMMQGFSCQSYWCYTQDFLSEQINSGNNDIQELWFGDRVPHLVQTCKSDENFRKMMLDCMYDLHDLFFKD